MNLFSFRKKDPVGTGAGQIEIVTDEMGQKALAFGLIWRSLVTSGGQDFAVKAARQAGSSHFILRPQQVGHGKLPGESGTLPKRIFPASVIAARHLLGDALCILQVSESEFWLALVRNGNPSTIDRLLTGVDASEALLMARAILADHAQDSTGSRIFVHTDIEHHGFESVKALSVQELLDAAIDDEELLQPLPKQKMSTPKPVLYIGALAVLVLGAQQAWKASQREEAQRLAAALRGQVIDPVAAWSDAIRVWQSTRAAPSAMGLAEPREALSRLPVLWDGWILEKASCDASPLKPGATDRQWLCEAVYGRKRNGALTRDMLPKMPEGWTASFKPLNQMTVGWSVSQPATAIDVGTLASAQFHRVESTSLLQPLQAAFAQEPTFTFEPLKIEAPKNRDGTAVPVDPRVAGLSFADFTVSAPLRSIDALSNTKLIIVWTSLSLFYDATNPKIALSSSSLMGKATGTFYAKN